MEENPFASLCVCDVYTGGLNHITIYCLICLESTLTLTPGFDDN